MLLLEILGGWIVLSCTLGPLLTWLFFYGERRERDRALFGECSCSPGATRKAGSDGMANTGHGAHSRYTQIAPPGVPPPELQEEYLHQL